MQTTRKIIDIVVPFASVLRRASANPSSISVSNVVTRALVRTFLFMWLASFIPVVGTLIYLIGFTAVAAWVHIKKTNTRTRQERAAIYVWYLTVITIEFGGNWGFIGHTFLAGQVAQHIGWLPDSQFQTELAFYHLGLGIAGLLAVWIKDNLITGLIIAEFIFWHGAAYVHIKDAIVLQNYSPLNIGGPLIGDIVIPTILLWLLYQSRFQR